MQAIILAAGMGKRLGEYTQDNTKCMLEVNGTRLIDRALESLYNIHVDRVVLVIGYKGKEVKNYLGNSYKEIPLIYVDNPVYDKTNNIYSLFLAKDFLLQDDTILMESDIIFDPVIIQNLLNSPYPNIALVDKYESWMDGTVVTLDEDLRITRFIDKEHFRFEEIKSYYKTVNIYKLSRDFSTKYYVPFLTAYCTALGNNEYYEQVLRVILHLRNAPLQALPLHGESWYEIDDVQDLDIASSIFANSKEEQYSKFISRYGGYWRYPQMLDFCYLANPFFPPQRMLNEMKACFETLLQNYPSGMRVNSLLASKSFGIKQNHIIVGNGAAELIKSLMEYLTGKIGFVQPTFEEYPNRISKERLIQFTPKTEGFRYDTNDIKEYFKDKGIKTLLLINPDNPSGNYIPFQELLDLIRWAQQLGIKLVVDESFVDFVDTEGQFSLLENSILSANPHLIVVKSISKSYGVPGLRLGILASGDTSMIDYLKKDVSIWNINSFAEFYLQIAEKYHQDYLIACSRFKEERNHLAQELATIPFLKVFPSQANFFLCEVLAPFTSRGLAVHLLQCKILIKDCSAKKGFNGKNYIRLAIKDRNENLRLIQALKTFCHEDYHS